MVKSASIAYDWRFSGYLLRTTHITCHCGGRHKNIELFDVLLANAIQDGQRKVMRQLQPHSNEVRLSGMFPINQVSRVQSIMTCPDCIDKLRNIAAVLPPITEAQWAETLRRKGAEDARRAKSLKETAKNLKPQFSLDAFLEEIENG